MKTFILFFVTSALFVTMAFGQAGSVLQLLNTIELMDVDTPPSSGGGFGSSVVSIGDLDQDGVEDLAVGATGVTSGGNGGAVYILFMNSNGTVKDTTKIASGLSGFGGQTGFGGRFGNSLAFLGDIDANGTMELVVGNPFNNGQGSNEGVVWILSLNQDGTVANYVEIGEGKSGFTGSLDNFEEFGHSLSRMPDIDSDGVPELIVGANNKNLGASGAGRVYLLKLNSSGNVKSHLTYDNNTPAINGDLKGNYRFGESVSVTEDLDQNGVPEILVGARGDDIAFTNRGAIWILFLDSQLNVSSIKRIHGKTPGFSQSPDSLSFVGRSIANKGDLDGDGIEDIIIGSSNGSINPSSTNLIKVLFMDSTGGIKNSSELTASNGMPFSPFNDPGVDFAGYPITLLNDIDGDGKRDLLTGAPAFNNGRGQIHILTLDGVSRIGLEEEPAAPNPISIFPNPTSGFVRVLMPDELSNQTVRFTLLDAMGKKLWERELTASGGEPVEFQLDSPPGVYHLHCVGHGFESIKKLIIQD